jgi:hypothetical protein
MNLYERHVYSDGQILFNRILSALLFSLKLILKLLVYSPLLFLSWFLANALLHDQVNKIIGLVLVLLLSYILYFVIYFFKGVLIALKFNGNFLWVPVFICAVLFTCAIPMYVIFDPVKTFIDRYADANQYLLTWIFTAAFGLYVYSKYYFLTNIAPVAAYPYYQRGIIITNHLLTFSKGFKAKRSLEIF